MLVHMSETDYEPIPTFDGFGELGKFSLPFFKKKKKKAEAPPPEPPPPPEDQGPGMKPGSRGVFRAGKSEGGIEEYLPYIALAAGVIMIGLVFILPSKKKKALLPA